MKPYRVKIVKTITTEIIVDAESASKANQTIRQYGLIEAVSDYPLVDETVSIRIANVKLKRRGE